MPSFRRYSHFVDFLAFWAFSNIRSGYVIVGRMLTLKVSFDAEFRDASNGVKRSPIGLYLRVSEAKNRFYM